MENRYDKYKDSGIAWIREIPEHWEITSFKRKITINNGKDYKDFLDAEIYPVMGSGGCFAYCSNYMYDGEALLLGRKGTIDRPLYVKGKFWAVDTMFYAIPHADLDCKFAYYLALMFPFNLYSTSTSLPSLTQTDLGNILVAFPFLSEQQSIATYLDQKCGEIDELITLQEEMITKLQSYKQSVITEAVTKGLDKNVPLKDSGIEWIGEIPEHWNICKLKNIFLLSTGTTPKDFDKISEGDNLINWYTPSDILDSCNDLFSSQRKLSEKVIYDNKIPLFPIGTLLYVGIGASAGKVGYANENGYSNQQITGLLPLECYSRFYFYYLSALKDKIRDNAFFTTLPIINNAYLGQELIPYPPIYEQQSIADYLDQKCSEIDELISIKQQKIVKLKDYKKSLIFECVTGKRKVS